MTEISSTDVSRVHPAPAPAGAITAWLDVLAPYAWLGAVQPGAVAGRRRCAVHWRAILLGVVFRHTGMVPLAEQGFRGDSVRRDVARLALRLDLECASVTAPPGTSLALARVFHAIDLEDPALAATFAETAPTAIFAKGEMLDSVEAAQAFAARLGPSATAAAAHALGGEARAALRTVTQDALAQGVFGAPFFIVDGEPFWGPDRLPLMDA